MTPVVSLPMYDWPEVGATVDRFWAAIRESLVEVGIDAPATRTRPVESIEHWRDPALLLSQTCGLPLRRHLLDDVAVIGAFDHRLPDTPPGHYHSAIIVPVDHPAETITDLVGATAAVNGGDSQSGHAALRHALIDHPAAVTQGIRSGSHRASIVLVADGTVDVAAIDAVSWAMAVTHEPAAARCRVLARTLATPGLPLVTAASNREHLAHLRLAVAHAIAGLSAGDREALHVHALIAASADDYAILDERWLDADRAGVPTLA